MKFVVVQAISIIVKILPLTQLLKRATNTVYLLAVVVFIDWMRMIMRGLPVKICHREMY